MTYQVQLYDPDGLSETQQRQAEQAFRRALEDSLGDVSLVVPVYAAYLRIMATHGEHPEPAAMTEAEREIVQQWQLAEQAAITAVYGPHRHLGDGMYEIRY